MKKLMLLLFFMAAFLVVHAQKCLDINIRVLMSELQVPGGASTCFNDCQTSRNDNGQTVITNYGTQIAKLDKLIQDNSMAFTNASLTGNTPNMPSNAQVQDYKAMAAKMQNMSPEERKTYAMQMAQKMQNANNQSASASKESNTIAMLVSKTQTIVVSQLTPLCKEYAAKFRAIIDKEKQERDAVKTPKYNSCPPVEKTGLPACNCVNALDGAYWQQIVNIENRYNEQKAALMQSYLPRVKALVGQVEDNINELHHGDDVKTATYKRILFSAQSSAFGDAFDVSTSIVKDIRKTGADAYVNKYNCDKLVYNLTCAHGM